MESEFKGVGCTIRKSRSSANPDRIVSSFYVKKQGAKLSAKEFNDFSFSEYEISDTENCGAAKDLGKNFDNEQPILDQAILSCHSALTQSPIVGSYFLPVFITALRSTKLNKISYDPDNGKWSNSSYFFEKLIDGGVTKALKELPGLNLLLLAGFDHVYSECEGSIPKAVQDRIIYKLSKYPSCFRNLDEVPNFVISGSARQELVKLRAALSMLTAPKRAAERAQ